VKLLLCILVLWQTADEWYATGVRLAGSGNPSGAVEAYRQAVQVNPKHIEAWNNLGDLLRRSGDRQGALDAIDHALQLNPNHPRAALNAALLRIELKQFKEALTFLDKARAGMGDQSALDYLAARAHLELNNVEAARPYLDRFRPSSASSPAGALELSTLLMDREEYAAAAEMLLSIPVERRTTEITLRVGQAWYALDQMEKARDAFTEVVQKSPGDFRGYLWQGYAERGLGNPESAEKALRRALDLNSESIEALVALSDLELDRDRAAESLDLSSRALQARPESAAALLVHGLALLHLQRFSEATAALTKIRPDAEEYGRALYPLSRAYRRLGQTEKADAALREFQALEQKNQDAATPGRKRPQ